MLLALDHNHSSQALLSPMQSHIHFVYEIMLIYFLQMLRRGLVLDLSIAFGQFDSTTPTTIHILHKYGRRYGYQAGLTLTSSQ